MTDHPSEPAFPSRHVTMYREENIFLGMTLRDWFAGQALAGLMSNSRIISGGASGAAWLAHEVADAMLREREK